MTTPSLALQAAIRAALIADANVMALVPATQIYDRHARPEVFPCIVIGENQEVSDDMRAHMRIYATMHVWAEEPGLVAVKEIVSAVRKALLGNSIVLLACINFRHESSRYLRDPSGVYSHGVVSFEAIVWEPQE